VGLGHEGAVSGQVGPVGLPGHGAPIGKGCPHRVHAVQDTPVGPEAIDAGAVGFLLRDADPATLSEAIRAAHRGEAPLDPRAALALIERRKEPTSAGAVELTPREREVLQLVGQGLSNRLVARRLGISEKTVKTHPTSVFTTIGVTDRVQAALWWQAHQDD
jgi:DNA-binding NarL/FixJ family response regulator